MKHTALLNAPLLKIAFCTALLISVIAHAAPKDEQNVCFRWAVGAMVGSGAVRELVAVTKDTALHTGDKLKLYVELQKECFVYLIYHSGQDEISLLFPYNLEQFTTDYKILKKYFIPHGDQWFELDTIVGTEKFYILASTHRLPELELFFTKNAEGTGDRKAHAQQVLAQIQKIKDRNRMLTARPERPVTIGGSVRGKTHDKILSLIESDHIAVEVSAHNFYSRTIAIEHH